MQAPEWLKDPKRSAKFHAGAAIFAAIQIPFAEFTPLKTSIAYVIFLSLWALVGQHWAAWQGTQAEQAAQDEK
jgi:hypothetical protein